MPYLAVGQENTRLLLALRVVDATGHLYNPTSVKFFIKRLSDGVQVFPTPSGSEDVTHYGQGVGVFPAWNTTANTGWKPTTPFTVGAHQIVWKYADPDGVAILEWRQIFNVVAAGLGLPYWTYIDPIEVRAEGITPAQLSDARMLVLLRRAQNYIERACRQPFRPTELTLKVDGPEAEVVHLGVPIIGVEHVKINDSTILLDKSCYRVYFTSTLDQYGGWSPEDNLHNPRIRMTAPSVADSIYRQGGGSARYTRPGRFAVGAQNQEIKGIFGALGPDGCTPELIRYAMLRLIYANTEPLIPGVVPAPQGDIASESTDRHSISYGTDSGAAPYAALSTCSEVEEIIRSHRAPIGISAPAPAWTYG